MWNSHTHFPFTHLAKYCPSCPGSSLLASGLWPTQPMPVVSRSVWKWSFCPRWKHRLLPGGSTYYLHTRNCSNLTGLVTGALVFWKEIWKKQVLSACYVIQVTYMISYSSGTCFKGVFLIVFYFHRTWSERFRVSVAMICVSTLPWIVVVPPGLWENICGFSK